MALGIFDLIGIVGMLIFALPVAIFALGRLAAGDLLVGGVLAVVAVLMVLLPYRLTTPGDIPSALAERAVGAVVPDDPTDEE